MTPAALHAALDSAVMAYTQGIRTVVQFRITTKQGMTTGMQPRPVMQQRLELNVGDKPCAIFFAEFEGELVVWLGQLLSGQPEGTLDILERGLIKRAQSTTPGVTLVLEIVAGPDRPMYWITDASKEVSS